VTGAGAVTAVVLLESAVGIVATAAWTQSWSVVRRGHFRIAAWTGAALAALALAAGRGEAVAGGVAGALVVATAAGAAVYVVAQYALPDAAATAVGTAAGALGLAALGATASLLPEWPQALAALEIVSGAALVGAVVNGMLLGHWYLNQPGLKPWALARLTALSLGALAASGMLGLVAAGRLAGAATPGAALGLPGTSDGFGAVFYAVWLGLVLFTAVVVLMARRCIAIRSIQSATGLYYVALLTAGVSEFVVRYLMLSS
jgi:hypothetical protein